MPDKPLYLVRHARNKARHWEITAEEIADVVDHPDMTQPVGPDRVNYWRQWRDSWLRVTVVHEENRTVVITVTPRRKGPEATR